MAQVAEAAGLRSAVRQLRRARQTIDAVKYEAPSMSEVLSNGLSTVYSELIKQETELNLIAGKIEDERWGV